MLRHSVLGTLLFLILWEVTASQKDEGEYEPLQA